MDGPFRPEGYGGGFRHALSGVRVQRVQKVQRVQRVVVAAGAVIYRGPLRGPGEKGSKGSEWGIALSGDAFASQRPILTAISVGR